MILFLKFLGTLNYLDRWSTSSKLDGKEKLCKLEVQALLITVAPCVLFYSATVLWFVPCRGCHVGYFLLAECSPSFWSHWFNNSSTIFFVTKLATKISFICVNYQIYSFAVHSIIFSASTMVIYPTCFRAFLKLFKEQFQNAKTKATQVKTTQLYRQIQILVSMFNGIHQGKIMLIGIMATVFIQVLPLTTFLLSMSALIIRDLPIILIAVMSAMNTCLAGMCTYLIMGSVHEDCLSTLRAVKANSKMEMKGWLKRFHVSCNPVRIKAGQNYIDRLTPLNIQDFVLNQVVTLLLLFN